MRMPMQGSCHSCTTFFPFPCLALPCYEPYIPLHCAYTAYIYPTPVRLAFGVWRFFFPFLSCILAPADPVGYLSHVLRLHRERTTGYCTCISVSLYLYLLLYIHLSLYTDFVYKRKACKLPARALSLSHPSLSVYLPSPHQPLLLNFTNQPHVTHY